MLELFVNKRGSVSMFLAIILVPMIVVTSLFVDASRLRLAKGVVTSAGDLTLNTVLTQYDPVLNDYYGLLASCQDIDEFLGTANEYFEACITSQGIEADDARKYADQISGLLTGEGGEIVDLLQIMNEEGQKFTVTEVPEGNLANKALVKKEIVEFMKYRAPINAVAELYEKFKESSEDLLGAEDNADLVEKKQEYYDIEGQVVGTAYEIYKKMVEYKEMGISKESVEELKNTVNGLEERYKRHHEKMVKDLYNTQGLTAFNVGTIHYNYTVSESDVNVEQVNSYINNLAVSIRDFKVAAEQLERTRDRMPDYDSGTMYDIQYWAKYDELLKSNSSYSTFTSRANSLIKNMVKLDKVMELLEEGKEQEKYDLGNYAEVDTGGEDTRINHYTKMKAQYEELKSTYIKNTYADFQYISNTLSQISRENINEISSANVDKDIKEIHRVLSEHYDSYDKAEKKLTEAVELLKDLKKLVDDYNDSLDAWSDAADTYTTKLAENDQKEISKMSKDIKENVTVENVQEMMDRLNNVKSLLGSLKKGIDDYKYNNYSIRKIENYSQFRSKSGVNKDSISYDKEELRKYVESSFNFTSSSVLQQTGITDNNHPSIDTVNIPELYKWMMKEFWEYTEDPKQTEAEIKQGKEDYKKEKDKEFKKEKMKYFGNDKEIKKLENRPSGGKGKDDGGTITKDLTAVSEFVTGLFEDFGKTMSGALTDARDSLFAMEYIMGMFTYDTIEYEEMYKKLEGNVTLKNCEDEYASVSSCWSNTDKKYRANKTLTNKMLNESNNYSYGNEVEYILYGKDNKANKDAAYGTIFSIRYVLDLMPMFMRYFGMTDDFIGDQDIVRLNTDANNIMALTQGIVPAALVKVVVVLGLTAMEAAADIKYLSKGMPVALVKNEEDVCEHYLNIAETEKEPDTSGFFYSDYLRLILLLKLSGASSQYNIYARTADVIQANMSEKIVPSEENKFLMSKAKVYFEANATVKVQPLIMNIPLVTNSGYSAPESGAWNTITYTGRRGY